SVFLGWAGNSLLRVRHEQSIVGRIKALGGRVYYDYQVGGQPNPPGPKFVRMAFGDDAFSRVEAVFLDYQSHAADEDLLLLTKLPDLKDVALHGSAISDDGVSHL